MAKESFYFPHDNNAHNDPKLMSLFMEFGLAGIGLYWILIEILHQQTDGRITMNQFEEYIRWYCSRERGEPISEQMFNKMFAFALFSQDDEGYVYSKRVLENKNYRQNISNLRAEAGKKSALARAKATNAKQNGTIAQQGKERKGKEIKEKELSIEESNGADAPTPAPGPGEIQILTFAQNAPAPKEENKTFFSSSIEDILLAFNFDSEEQKEKVRVEIEKFREYWMEKNSTGTKMRWQMQETFEVKRRLRTWFGNVKGFTSPGFVKTDRVGKTINIFE